MKTLAKKPRRPTRSTLLNGTVPPRWAPYADRRPREYLTPKEVERLIAGARKRARRYSLRDATMILVTYRHGLRNAELCTLTWDQIDFSQGMMHVRRLKERCRLRAADRRGRDADVARTQTRRQCRPVRVHDRARCADDTGGLP